MRQQARLGIGPYLKSNVKLGKAKEAIATPKVSTHSVSYTRFFHLLFKLGLSHWLYHRIFSASSCPKPESSESRTVFVRTWNRQVQRLLTWATRLHWKSRVLFMKLLIPVSMRSSKPKAMVKFQRVKIRGTNYRKLQGTVHSLTVDKTQLRKPTYNCQNW